nr:uncharacterized protein LOC110360169 isoform X5 [Columba livia]XP_021146034.1 uncharacterized protein LOC110360169 isoform X5 [Columba livia]
MQKGATSFSQTPPSFAFFCMQSQHLLCALPGHKPPPRHVAEDRSISNTVTRGGQVGGEQAKAEGELPQEGSSKGRGKSAPAFPRLRTVPVLAASSAGEEERPFSKQFFHSELMKTGCQHSQ